MALVKKYYYCHVALVYGNDSCGTEHTVALLRGELNAAVTLFNIYHLNF
jgi:hypothetical protein